MYCTAFESCANSIIETKHDSNDIYCIGGKYTCRNSTISNFSDLVANLNTDIANADIYGTIKVTQYL